MVPSGKAMELWLVNLSLPPTGNPGRYERFNSRPYQGKPMAFISPDHKRGYFGGGFVGGDRLTSH